MLRIVLAFLAFMAVGFPDTLLGVAWPTLRMDLDVSFNAVGWIVLAGTAGYCASALIARQVLQRFGLGWVLVLSTLITALGLLCFAFLGHFLGLVVLTLVLGTGGGAIDAGLNHYVIDNHGEGLMQWMHASFGVGVTIAPALMGLAVAQGSYQTGYVWAVMGLLALAFLFVLTAKVWPRLSLQDAQPAQAAHNFRLWLAVVMFMVYVGCEVVVGVMAYSVFVEARGINTLTAAGWVSLYWGSFTACRIAAGFVAGRLSHWRLVRWGLSTALVGALVFVSQPFAASEAVAMILLGVGFGPLYPSLMSGTQDRVGEINKDAAVGLQIGLSVFGSGVLTLLIGYLGDGLGRDFIPWAVLVMILALIAGAAQQGRYQLSTR